MAAHVTDVTRARAGYRLRATGYGSEPRRALSESEC